ncbi:hypothetical protein DB356_22275 [Pseudomonas congelans]|uniref:hypothetical protein n=1 Tax=Pseudomonas congelans TaxID=200452 RepID=UPI001BDBC1D1|nr:hypothetical protein [Pseudomonas congelans]QVX17210.1 hypothetical protein DB356_22275 [Pseudomonas congelans]
MTELQHVVSLTRLYERLIDRLGLALETASTSVRLRNELPDELELKGLSRAEFQLIEAYLEKGNGDAGAAVVDTPASSGLVAAELGRSPLTSATIVWLKDRRRAKASVRLGRNT